jgi:hypothetical protein
MVAVLDGTEWRRWFPLGEPVEEPFDRNHFNSFYFDERTVGVLAHNWGPSTLHLYDKAKLEAIRTIPLGVDAHNVWTQEGEFMTCSSREGRIVGDRGFSLETGGFPRGIARDGDMTCVGISTIAERNERDYTSGILKVYDGSWHLREEMVLTGEGLLLDVLPYPVRRGPTLPPNGLK